MGREALTLDINQGAYYNGGWKYANSSYAVTQYEQQNGAHYWRTAAAGTAGNTISFTQAMTLDDIGALNLGYTYRYAPSGGGYSRQTVGYDVNDRINLVISNQNSGSSGAASLVLATYGRDWIIGTGSSANNGNALTFSSATVECARIDSSGNLLVGTTSAVGGSASRLQVVAAGSSSEIITVKETAGGAGFRYFISFQNSAGTYIGSINTTGTNTTYSTSSDYRLKENIQPMTGALARSLRSNPAPTSGKQTALKVKASLRMSWLKSVRKQ